MGRRSHTPTRQSKLVGRNFWAMMSSDFSNSLAVTSASSSSVSAFVTPMEKALSGCFNTHGKPRLLLISPTLFLCTIMVLGMGTLCRAINSAR